MGSYCCFLCPSEDFTDKSLNDLCPKCKKPYGFPISHPPEKIREYSVVQHCDRGFYSATYLCHRGKLRKPWILKVIPVEIYKYFKKNFEDECETHSQVAEGTEHIVKIDDYFDAQIEIGDENIYCHVAVLEHVKGTALDEFLKTDANINSRSIAQISIDLFRIWREFKNKLKHHNDLHKRNIIVEHLSFDARRAEAIDDSIRTVAIDLGSVADQSKSNACEQRLGDQHWLSQHLQCMVEILRKKQCNLDIANDLDIRLVESLEWIVSIMLPAAHSGRLPTDDQIMRIVRDEFFRNNSYSKWKEPFRLESMDDHYNAYTLGTWYIPNLLVDPDNSWIREISKAGPLLITGMRGCGKTMLLGAIDFHARAFIRESESENDALQRIKEDNYVGLLTSCMQLLLKPKSTTNIFAFERLFCSYCIQAIRAVRHLSELDPSNIVPRYHDYLSEVLEINLGIPLSEAFTTDYDLERYLLKLIVSFRNSVIENELLTSPPIAFESLATAICKCTKHWANSKIFFLLDDASTRYLEEEVIMELFSGLIFQNSKCAFKITTEAQTLELGLYSPGHIEIAREGRDFEIFDLGAEAYKMTKSHKTNGKLFIERILEQRAKYYPTHPNISPREILGDCTLESIAQKIANTSASSRERKSVYFGISALSALCVGDIGDVIMLYEMILRKAIGKPYPILAEIQSECYQDFCSRRLYHLNQRNTKLKNWAIAYAEAAYELLIKSSRAQESEKRKELRQYNSIYVKVTTGDTEKQFKELRSLVDAGLFVYFGGTPRTKTRDKDPLLQFKLVFRKLFGLSNYIGLAERDRFELSGNRLEEWLSSDNGGKDILLNSPKKEEAIISHLEICGENDDGGFNRPQDENRFAETLEQQKMFVPSAIDDVFSSKLRQSSEAISWLTKRIKMNELTFDTIEVDTIIIGLGFEERSLESARKLMSITKPKNAILVEYEERGKGDEIEELIFDQVKNVKKIKYNEFLSDDIIIPGDSVLVDITGLIKPILFNTIRRSLVKHNRIYIVYTSAKDYYPLNSDILGVLEAEEKQNHYQLLERLSLINTGESDKYEIFNLIKTDVDESRPVVLCAFASAKHQRLLTLLDIKDFNQIEIATPSKGTPRREIARITSEVAAFSFQNSVINEVDSDDFDGTLLFLMKNYANWYLERGCNLEIGLTGSKMQAVACAAFSIVCKLAQCWYVKPHKFDPKTFTKGFGDSQLFLLSVNERLKTDT